MELHQVEKYLKTGHGVEIPTTSGSHPRIIPKTKPQNDCLDKSKKYLMSKIIFEQIQTESGCVEEVEVVP